MKKLLVLLLISLCPFFMVHSAAQLSVSTTVIANVHCYGQNNGTVIANPSGGTLPYTYKWAPGLQTTQTIGGLTAGTYTINVKDHAGLTVSATAIVTQPSTLIASVSAKYGSVCPGVSDSLYASGTGGTIPYQYAWSGPIGDISCVNCQNTSVYPTGISYIVTALNDMNGCTASASVSVTVRPFPYVSITGSVSPIIASHNDTLVAVSPGASSYLWSNSSTTSSIIVSPAVTTTYSVKTTNTYGCYDTTHYTVSPNSNGNGSNSSSAIVVSSSTNVTTTSYSTTDSVVWFSFVASNSNTQIIAYGNYLGLPFPHVHRLSLYDSTFHTLVDEPMPDIAGANQIRIDASNLAVGHKYYVRAARCPAQANMAGCNPSSSGECNPSQRWDFQMCFRTVPVFVPDDSSHEAPSISQLYYEHRGQIPDMNGIPRFDIKAYTNFAYPAVFASDSAVSFVYDNKDTIIDTAQRVDMILTGTSVQPSQPVFKMQEDSGAGYLNYFLGYVPNGVPKVEGYSRLVYKNVYPNVDLQIFSNSVGTKLYFICAPAGSGVGAGNPADIELQFKGASSVSVNGSGGLDVATELGTLTFAPGFAYTDSAGIVKAQSWQAYFIAVNSNTVRFNTGTFNSNEPLVIEVDRGHEVPLVSSNLEWSTFYGSLGSTLLLDVYTNDQGNVYVTGSTTAPDFPVLNGFDTSYNLAARNNAVIAKFDSLDRNKWSTYYGGSVDDRAYSVVADVYGNVYVTGYTYSPDFPVSQPSIHTYPDCYYAGVINNGNPTCREADAFIVMLNSSGNFNSAPNYVPWATYYGGCDGYGANHGEVGLHLALDKLHNLYAVGGHISPIIRPALPRVTEAGAYNSDTGTGFILKFNVDVTNHTNFGKCEWATDIGGRNDSLSSSVLQGCAVDASNNFYVVGNVTESGYPIVNPGANSSFEQTSTDGVITKFSAANNSIDWSTYFGSDTLGVTGVKSITTDPSGNAYITGSTDAFIPLAYPGWPYYYLSFPSNAYIGMFNPGGTLYWSTYIGNVGVAGEGIACDSNYNVVVVGDEAASCSLFAPNAPPGLYYSVPFGSGQVAFITDFNITSPPDLPFSDTSNYVWGTPFGGWETQYAFADAINSKTSQLYMVGSTTSPGNTPCPGTCPFPLDSGNGVPTFYGTNIGASYATSYGDGYIAQFGLEPLIPTAVKNVNTLKNEVKVYPNPTEGNSTVELLLQQPQKVEFIVYDLLGHPVYSEVINEPSGIIYKTISTSALPNGNYILQVVAGNSVYHAKITKLQ